VPDTGEIILNGEASPIDTPKGQYELKIRAWDYGVPPKSAETRVNIRVGVAGNQRPYFRGNEKHENGISFYNFTIPEDIQSGVDIYQLEAVDPDGATGQLSYFLPDNGRDNFEVEIKSGMLRTTGFVHLNLDRNPPMLRLKVSVSVDTTRLSDCTAFFNLYAIFVMK